MARIVVFSLSYLGDVGPFVGPANELVERGHEVTFLTSDGFQDLLGNERFDLATYPIDLSPSAYHADPEYRRIIRHPRRNGPALIRYLIRRMVLDDPEDVRSCLLDTLQGADLAFGHFALMPMLAPAAEHLGIPTVAGHLFPWTIPTSHWAPPMSGRSADLGPRANRLLWRSMEAMARAGSYNRKLNDYRRSFGVEPMRLVVDESWTSATRTLILASPYLYGEPAPDWPPMTWTGTSTWVPSLQDPVPAEVEEFLDHGEPPVLVTLGSATSGSAGDDFATIADGLDSHGKRSLLLVGDRERLCAVGHRPGAVSFAPLPAVLPRCRAAVVSGALGSLSAALEAGVPVVVHPQLFLDQRWHAERVEELGLGLHARKAGDVAHAVARVDADPSFRRRAQEYAAAVDAEDAPRAVADEVEAVLRASRRLHRV